MTETSRGGIIAWVAVASLLVAAVGQAQMCGGGSGGGGHSEHLKDVEATDVEATCCRMSPDFREALLSSSYAVRDLMAQVATDRASLTSVAVGDTLSDRLMKHLSLLEDLMIALTTQEGLLNDHLLGMAGEDGRAPEQQGHRH